MPSIPHQHHYLQLKALQHNRDEFKQWEGTSMNSNNRRNSSVEQTLTVLNTCYVKNLLSQSKKQIFSHQAPSHACDGLSNRIKQSEYANIDLLCLSGVYFERIKGSCINPGTDVKRRKFTDDEFKFVSEKWCFFRFRSRILFYDLFVYERPVFCLFVKS